MSTTGMQNIADQKHHHRHHWHLNINVSR